MNILRNVMSVNKRCPETGCHAGDVVDNSIGIVLDRI